MAPNNFLNRTARVILRIQGMTAEQIRQQTRKNRQSKPMPKARGSSSKSKQPDPGKPPASGSIRVRGQTSAIRRDGQLRNYTTPGAQNRAPTVDPIRHTPSRGPAVPPRGRAGTRSPGQLDMGLEPGKLARREGGGALTRQRGGAMVPSPGGRLASTRQPSQRALAGRTPRALPGGTGGADRVRGSGVRTGQPGPSRPALPPGQRGGALATRSGLPPSLQRTVDSAIGNSGARARGGRLGRGATAASALAGMLTPAVDSAGQAMGRAIGSRIRSMFGGKDKPQRRPQPNRPLPNFPTATETKARENGGNRPPAPRASGSSSRPSGGAGSSPRNYSGSGSGGGSGTNTPSRASAPSSESRAKETPSTTGSDGMSQWRTANPKLAEALDKRNATRGTSKTDNPLMKDFIPGMKRREADSASKSEPSQPTSSAGETPGQLADRIRRSAGKPIGGEAATSSPGSPNRSRKPQSPASKKRRS